MFNAKQSAHPGPAPREETERPQAAIADRPAYLAFVDLAMKGGPGGPMASVARYGAMLGRAMIALGVTALLFVDAPASNPWIVSLVAALAILGWWVQTAPSSSRP